MIDDVAPLEQVRKLQFHDTPRTRHYSAQLDAGLAEALATFDLDQLPFADPPEQTLRLATATTGLMAFCWANPWSRYHHDARLLEHIRQRLLTFATTHDDGLLRLRRPGLENNRELDNMPRESHGNSWWLEPLIFAALWVRDELSDEQRQTIDRMIRRAADVHAAIPLNESNNRGVIRQAILALAGQYLNDRHLIDIAVRDFHRAPVQVFNERDGQILEGAGPDANYSGTTYIYLYMYRLMSGDASIDRNMIDALRWFTWTSDPRGHVTLFGAATRKPTVGPDKVADFLPALERYADVHPQFSWLLDHSYLKDKQLGGPHHCICPLIWGMLEHNGRPPREEPDWFERRNLKRYKPSAGPELMYANEGYAVLYFTLREKNHHATTTVVGRSPYKGMQHWGYRDEPAVVWPTESHASRTVAWGLDSSQMNANGCKFRDKTWHEGPPAVFVMRIDNLWHHYLLTPTTLLLLISGSYEKRQDIWVADRAQCGTPQLDGQAVVYEGRQGRLHFAGDAPQLKPLANAHHLVFETEKRTQLYAFSNDSFQLEPFDSAGDRCVFADDTGRYQLEYELRFDETDAIREIAYNVGWRAASMTSAVRTVASRLGDAGSR